MRNALGLACLVSLAACGSEPADAPVDAGASSPDVAQTSDLAPTTCVPACVAPTPHCNAARNCVGCLVDADCPAGYLCRVSGPDDARCVQGCADDARCRAGGAPPTMACCGNACADTARDVLNCGACGTRCQLPHAQSACVNAACALGKCDSGWGDCNGNPADGCEVNLHVDPANCTGCGKKCGIPNAIAACADGCYLTACNFGFDDCNMNAMDGCEATVLSDVKNCGACGTSCGFPIRGTATCITGNCLLKSCDVGYADCNSMFKDGCEIATGTDRNNCGACGNVCAQGLVCIGGMCTCPNCNFANAKAACVNLKCVLDQCNTNFGNCDANDVNGCETPLASDVNNCGACGKKCAQGLVCMLGGCTCPQCNIPNAKSACINNQCVLDSCLPGFGDCNGFPQDGCEVDFSNTPAHCGGCGKACPMNMMVCVNSTCTDVPVNPFFNSMPVQTGQTVRAAGSPCGTLLTANQSKSTVAIAVNVSLPVQTNIKFMIWTHPGHQLVYISNEKLFPAGSGWMKSDPFPAFLLQAGMSYDIGGTADQGNVTYFYDQVAENSNGIVSLVQNPNWTNYQMPVMGGHAAVDCAIQLF